MSVVAHVEDDERFRLSPRQYVDLEEFGRIANPSATINVDAPTVDPYEYAAMHHPATVAPGEWPMDSIWEPHPDDPVGREPGPADRTNRTARTRNP